MIHTLVADAPYLQGIAWSNRGQIPSWTAGNIQNIATNGSILVAVGDTGRLAYSTDGVNWTWSTAISSLNTSTKFCANYVMGKFLAVGFTTNGTTQVSTDGVNWSSETALSTAVASTSVQLYSTATNGSIVVVVGSSTKMVTSTNMSTWTLNSSIVSALAATNKTLYDVYWTGTQFITGGLSITTGVVATSPDGLTWTSRTSAFTAATNQIPRAFATNGTILLSGGYTQSGTAARLAYSTDSGVSWTDITSNLTASGWSSGTGNGVYDIKWDGRRFIALGANGSVAISKDGLTWQYVPLLASSSWGTNQLRKGVFYKNRMVAVGGVGLVATSP